MSIDKYGKFERTNTGILTKEAFVAFRNLISGNA